jgi:hypothetical protein
MVRAIIFFTLFVSFFLYSCVGRYKAESYVSFYRNVKIRNDSSANFEIVRDTVGRYSLFFEHSSAKKMVRVGLTADYVLDNDIGNKSIKCRDFYPIPNIGDTVFCENDSQSYIIGFPFSISNELINTHKHPEDNIDKKRAFNFNIAVENRLLIGEVHIVRTYHYEEHTLN